MTVSCCNHRNHHKTCKRKDGKKFSLPRFFSKSKCKKPKGFTMKASCSPYLFCSKKKNQTNKRQKRQRRQRRQKTQKM